MQPDVARVHLVVFLASGNFVTHTIRSVARCTVELMNSPNKARDNSEGFIFVDSVGMVCFYQLNEICISARLLLPMNAERILGFLD